MNLNFELYKDFCTPRDVARVIWENAILAHELGFVFNTQKIGLTVIKPKAITINYINAIVCKYYNIPIEVLYMKTRKREIVQARQIAMFFAKNLTKDSLQTIGDGIGNKDHATVLHASKTINNLIDTNRQFKLQVEEIERLIK